MKWGGGVFRGAVQFYFLMWYPIAVKATSCSSLGCNNLTEPQPPFQDTKDLRVLNRFVVLWLKRVVFCFCQVPFTGRN